MIPLILAGAGVSWLAYNQMPASHTAIGVYQVKVPDPAESKPSTRKALKLAQPGPVADPMAMAGQTAADLLDSVRPERPVGAPPGQKTAEPVTLERQTDPSSILVRATTDSADHAKDAIAGAGKQLADRLRELDDEQRAVAAERMTLETATPPTALPPVRNVGRKVAIVVFAFCLALAVLLAAAVERSARRRRLLAQSQPDDDAAPIDDQPESATDQEPAADATPRPEAAGSVAQLMAAREAADAPAREKAPAVSSAPAIKKIAAAADDEPITAVIPTFDSDDPPTVVGDRALPPVQSSAGLAPVAGSIGRVTGADSAAVAGSAEVAGSAGLAAVAGSAGLAAVAGSAGLAAVAGSAGLVAVAGSGGSRAGVRSVGLPVATRTSERQSTAARPAVTSARIPSPPARPLRQDGRPPMPPRRARDAELPTSPPTAQAMAQPMAQRVPVGGTGGVRPGSGQRPPQGVDPRVDPRREAGPNGPTGDPRSSRPAGDPRARGRINDSASNRLVSDPRSNGTLGQRVVTDPRSNEPVGQRRPNGPGNEPQRSIDGSPPVAGRRAAAPLTGSDPFAPVTGRAPVDPLAPHDTGGFLPAAPSGVAGPALASVAVSGPLPGSVPAADPAGGRTRFGGPDPAGFDSSALWAPLDELPVDRDDWLPLAQPGGGGSADVDGNPWRVVGARAAIEIDDEVPPVSGSDDEEPIFVGEIVVEALRDEDAVADLEPAKPETSDAKTPDAEISVNGTDAPNAADAVKADAVMPAEAVDKTRPAGAVDAVGAVAVDALNAADAADVVAEGTIDAPEAVAVPEVAAEVVQAPVAPAPAAANAVDAPEAAAAAPAVDVAEVVDVAKVPEDPQTAGVPTKAADASEQVETPAGPGPRSNGRRDTPWEHRPAPVRDELEAWSDFGDLGR